MRLLAAVGLAALVAGCGAAREGAAPPENAQYTDPTGWTVAYPPELHVEHSEAQFRLSWWEATFATFQPEPPIRSGHTESSAWWQMDLPANESGAFPVDGAALRVSRSDGGPAPDLEFPETPLPIRLADLEPSEHLTDPVRPLEKRIEANGLGYTVQVWFGREVRSETRALIDEALASLRFPLLHPGEVVGHGFTVMQPAADYPVGSVTRVQVERQPFYLVHAPGGFYALGWRWQSLAGGYKSGCDVVFEPASFEFQCPRLGAVWDRIGRVITRPADARDVDPLNMTIAKVGEDGHLLLHPGVARFARREEAKTYWPRWAA